MVTIIDVNDVSPAFKLPWTRENPFYTISILEEQPIGSVIGKYIAIDDSGIDHYDIIPQSPYIEVNRTTGNFIKLSIKCDLYKYNLIF